MAHRQAEPGGSGDFHIPQQLEAATNADLLAQVLQLGPQGGQQKVLPAGDRLLDVHQVALQET